VSLLIPALDLLTSLLLGCALFSALGVLASERNVEVSGAIDQPAALTFVIVSEAVLKLPFPAIWSAAFFLVLICLGVSTQYVLIEAFVTAVCEEWHKVTRLKRNENSCLHHSRRDHCLYATA